MAVRLLPMAQCQQYAGAPQCILRFTNLGSHAPSAAVLWDRTKYSLFHQSFKTAFSELMPSASAMRFQRPDPDRKGEASSYRVEGCVVWVGAVHVSL